MLLVLETTIYVDCSYLTERYDQLMQSWVKRVERLENNTKRRAKDAKTREFFEKVFPELKKQREDKDRIQRYKCITCIIFEIVTKCGGTKKISFYYV